LISLSFPFPSTVVFNNPLIYIKILSVVGGASLWLPSSSGKHRGFAPTTKQQSYGTQPNKKQLNLQNTIEKTL